MSGHHDLCDFLSSTLYECPRDKNLVDKTSIILKKGSLQLYIVHPVGGTILKSKGGCLRIQMFFEEPRTDTYYNTNIWF